jgi:hypothetical protein
MRTRLEALRRLVNVYTAVEEMHSIESRRTAAAVRETQLAIGREHQAMHFTRSDGRKALLEGDMDGRVLAEARHDAAIWRRRALEKIRLERETLNVAAKEQYMASSVKREQVSSIFRDIVGRIEIEEGRRTQALSDDRFLARRRWTDSQRKNRDDQ